MVRIRRTVQTNSGPRRRGEGHGGRPSLEIVKERRFILASTAIGTDFVEVVANEMARGVEKAVECWMSQVEQALTDVHLTSLGRLNAAREVLDQYKRLTGKAQLGCRRI